MLNGAAISWRSKPTVALFGWSCVHICLLYGPGPGGDLSSQVPTSNQTWFSSDCTDSGVCRQWNLHRLVWGFRRLQWVPVTVRSMSTFAFILCTRLVRLVIFNSTKLTVSSMLPTYSPMPPHPLMSSLTFAVVWWSIKSKHLHVCQEVKEVTTACEPALLPLWRCLSLVSWSFLMSSRLKRQGLAGYSRRFGLPRRRRLGRAGFKFKLTLLSHCCLNGDFELKTDVARNELCFSAWAQKYSLRVAWLSSRLPNSVLEVEPLVIFIRWWQESPQDLPILCNNRYKLVVTITKPRNYSMLILHTFVTKCRHQTKSPCW